MVLNLGALISKLTNISITDILAIKHTSTDKAPMNSSLYYILSIKLHGHTPPESPDINLIDWEFMAWTKKIFATGDKTKNQAGIDRWHSHLLDHCWCS